VYFVLQRTDVTTSYAPPYIVHCPPVPSLLIGIDVATDAARVVTVARGDGFIVNATGPHTVRLAPPLVLGDDEAEAFLAAWPGILDDAVEPDDSAD
jgi:acetylornithine aminotransferase